MVRTVEQHAEAIAALVGEALQGRGGEYVEVDPMAHLMRGDLFRRRVLVEDVLAPIDLPPFDNSQMDGYAIASTSVAAGGTELPVAPRIAAGQLPGTLTPGTAAPIMTGAPIPAGADAVIPIEMASPDRFLPETGDQRVTLDGPVPAEQFVRRAGSDIRLGQVLLEAGTVLRSAHWGVLAASGVETVEVRAMPRILVISTGSELVGLQNDLVAGTIHDANGASLVAALSETGAEVTLTRVADDADALIERLQQFHPGDEAPPLDLVITTGGVSAGAYEVVRDAFESRGVHFESVAMQPGGPQGWGRLDLDGFSVPVVCFPGNPVSVLVSYEAFVRVPLLEGLGHPLPRRDLVAKLAEGADSPAGKHQIRRGRLDADGTVHLVGGPSSHLLHAYATSNALVHVPLGTSRVEAGDEVVVWPLDD